jgi:RNA polymerase sigma factor (sigma-70 family)
MKDYYVDNSEIVSLIDQWKLSEDKQSIEKEILKKLSYLIYAKIKVYRKESFYDDLVQEGKLALLNAINDFDKERGANFFVVASWHLSSRFKKTLKKDKRCNTFVEEVIDPYEIYESKEQIKYLHKAIKELPDIYKRIIVMRYGVFGSETYTLQQIGDMFSMSKQYVDQLEQRAIEKLKKNVVVREMV